MMIRKGSSSRSIRVVTSRNSTALSAARRIAIATLHHHHHPGLRHPVLESLTGEGTAAQPLVYRLDPLLSNRQVLLQSFSTNASSSSTPAAGASLSDQNINPSSRLRQRWDDGSILLFTGFATLGVVLLDRYLQYQDRQEASDAAAMIVEETKQKRRELLEKSRNVPHKFTCEICTEFDKMGGSHGLKDLKLGDVVEVLEEGVGPGNGYNLCRIRSQSGEVDAVGWFPMSYMKKIQVARKRWFW
jgi:hypothetical protein